MRCGARKSMGHQEHKTGLTKSIGCMVITCSDSRTVETDTSGAAIMEMLKEGGHHVAAYHLVKDEPGVITDLIKQGAKDPAVQAMIINGGTGIKVMDKVAGAAFGSDPRYLWGTTAGAAVVCAGCADCVVLQPASATASAPTSTTGAKRSTPVIGLERIERLIMAPSGPQTGSGNKALTLTRS